MTERDLGNGGFGTVLTASLDGEVQVAVKKLNNQNVRTDLLEEIRKSVQEFHALQVRSYANEGDGGGGQEPGGTKGVLGRRGGGG